MIFKASFPFFVFLALGKLIFKTNGLKSCISAMIVAEFYSEVGDIP